jgi:hypothetical protein
MLYHIRDAVVLGLLLVFFLIETAGNPVILLYLRLPVAALIIGGVVIALMVGFVICIIATAKRF